MGDEDHLDSSAGASAVRGLTRRLSRNNLTASRRERQGSRAVEQHGKPKDTQWEEIRERVITIYNGHKVPLPVEDINELLTKLMAARGLQEVVDNIKKVMTQGNFVLQFKMKDYMKEGPMRQSFEQVWTLFHQHVMPNLQALFLPVQLQSIASPVSLKPRGPIDIRNMALVSFRESICFSEPVLSCLNTEIEQANGKLPPCILQPLLLMQGLQYIDDRKEKVQQHDEQEVKIRQMLSRALGDSYLNWHSTADAPEPAAPTTGKVERFDLGDAAVEPGTGRPASHSISSVSHMAAVREMDEEISV